MRGVLGLLLIVVGLEVAYLVLAGKLPLQLKPAKAGGAGGGPDSGPGPDARLLAFFGTPRTHPYVGMPVPIWGGLQK